MRGAYDSYKNYNKIFLCDGLYKPYRRIFPLRRVIIKDEDEFWQNDLYEMTSYSSENNGYKYVLTVTLTFLNKACARLISNK